MQEQAIEFLINQFPYKVLYSKLKTMRTNLWNLSHSKERLSIIQKTEAQKRHLISIVNIKSKLNSQPKFQKIKSLNQSFQKEVKSKIHMSNQALVNKICKIQRFSISRTIEERNKENKKISSITTNLRSMAQISRVSRISQIAKENIKLCNRLTNVNPTFSKQKWKLETNRAKMYKINISRAKYCHPDYSMEVSRSLRKGACTLRHLKLSRLEEMSRSR